MLKLFLTFFFTTGKEFIRFCVGSYKIMRIKQPCITIFGGSRIPPIKKLYQQAHELAYALAEKGTTIITGGGPGIMEAASCGTTHIKHGRNIGVGIESLQSNINMYLSDYIELKTFFMRKQLLISFSQAFILFPGGYGTLDELMEVLNLIKVGHLKAVPVILINKEYWHDIINWMKTQFIPIKEIQSEDISLMSIVDSNEEVLTILDKHIFSKQADKKLPRQSTIQ